MRVQTQESEQSRFQRSGDRVQTAGRGSNAGGCGRGIRGESVSELPFTIVDKRGQAHIEQEKPVIVEAEPPKTPSGSKRIWKSTGFMVAMAKSPNGILIVGRAVGLRQDGVCALADYAFPPIWPEKLDWVKHATQRLNTFLGCDCTPQIMCEMHRKEVPKWGQEDMTRLEHVARVPLPEAIEVVMKAEQERQKTRIVVPR
jgi:hypothetical protein